MHPCFDAVRWQGLGEMVRGVSDTEQIWLASQFEVLTEKCLPSVALRHVCAAFAEVLLDGVPPQRHSPPSRYFPIGSAVCYTMPTGEVRYGFVTRHEQYDRVEHPYVEVVLHQGTLREQRDWVRLELVRPATLQEVMLYTRWQGHA